MHVAEGLRPARRRRLHVQRQATDTLGNTDPTPATRAFTLDTVVPTVSITSGPSGLINVTSASFGFSAETGATTTCQMDTGAFTSCTSPAAYSSLAQGSHTFTVRATDAAGNVGSASRSLTVDSIAPAAPAIIDAAERHDAGPSTVTVGGTAEPSASVQLFDGGVAKSTTTASGQGTWSVTLNGVGDGAHPYTAKATDAAGNVSVASNTRTITVDTTAPETTITSGPIGATNGTSPSFGFSSETGATFQCKLDGPGATTGSYAACTSPKAYGPLGDGVYTFSVRATDGVGNTDVTPATRGFTVDTVAAVGERHQRPERAERQHERVVRLHRRDRRHHDLPDGLGRVRELHLARGVHLASPRASTRSPCAPPTRPATPRRRRARSRSTRSRRP